MGELDPELQRDLVVTALRDGPLLPVLIWLYLRMSKRISDLADKVKALAGRHDALMRGVSALGLAEIVGAGLPLRNSPVPEPAVDERTGSQH